MAEFYRPAWDPCEDAQPKFCCPICGHPIYDGDEYYTGHGTDHVAGCEHCLDRHLA